MTKRLLLALLIFGLPILGLGQKKKTKNPHYQLLGGKPSKRLGMAKLASATEHLTKDDPPVILLYGSEDKSLVKRLHGKRLKTRYVQTGLHATYQLTEGAGHGGPQYRDEKRRGHILPMLEKTFRKSLRK